MSAEAAEQAFRTRTVRPENRIFNIVLGDGDTRRCVEYQVEGERVTITLFSGATMYLESSAIDYVATLQAWENEREPTYGVIDGTAQESIVDAGVFLQWFREQVDRAFRTRYSSPNRLSGGAPPCDYVESNPTDVLGGDVCVAYFRMSEERPEWVELQVRGGRHWEAAMTRTDSAMKQIAAYRVQLGDDIGDAPMLSIHSDQLELLSTIVRLTLADARANGVSVQFTRASGVGFDDFGQPLPATSEPYWSFAISRETAARIGWENFQIEAWPRIADAFSPGVFSEAVYAEVPRASEPYRSPGAGADQIDEVGRAPATRPATADPPGNALEIVDVSTRVTERNDSWWRFAWILELRNNSAAPITVDATIEFVDADGFVIDDVNEYRLGLAPGTQRQFTGSTLISMPGAQNVRGARAKAGSRDPSAPITNEAPDGSRALIGALAPANALPKILEADPRNAGIEATATSSEPGILEFNIQSISGDTSMVDVFRVFLQFADELQKSSYSAVYLAFRGDRRFVVPGEYFSTLGREYGTQNPVYTTRVFPSQIKNLDGSAAYPTWTGGMIGVLNKQMEDVQDLHRKWYLNDLLRLHRSPVEAAIPRYC